MVDDGMLANNNGVTGELDSGMIQAISGPQTSEEKLAETYVARRVIEKMCNGALRFSEFETGEAMIGLANQRNGERLPEIYILDTISPAEGTVREWGMFEQGDDWQSSIINWWNQNWELYRQIRAQSYGNAAAAKWDMPLVHLGDWHKQPGQMIAPSRGDLRTARNMMRDLERDYILAPIVTLTDADDTPGTNSLIVETPSAYIRIDFWWLGRRANGFQPLQPLVKSNAFFPRLPPVAWWLERRERFDEEIATLEADGLQVMDIKMWDTRGHPPLETCLTLYRPGSRWVIIAVTSVNYPFRPPQWRVAPIMRPKEDEDLFELLFQASSEISEETLPEWRASMRLVDVVNIIEKKQRETS
jgi:hypothetical protein